MDEARHHSLGLWSIAVIIGIVSTVSGSILIALSLILPQLQDDILTVVMASTGMICTLLGGALIWSGSSGWQGKSSSTFYSKVGWIIFLILSIAALAAGAIVPVRWHTSPVFALIQVSVITFPALFLLSLIQRVAGPQGALTLRQIVLLMTGGMMSVFIALPIEVIGFVFSAIIVGALAVFIPGGEAEISRLTTLAEQWMLLPPSDMEELLAIVTSPIVLGILALTLAVVTPLIEELGKTIVVGVAARRKRPEPLKAFLWGATAGLGFAIIEGVSNGALGLGDPTGWIGGIASRLLATVMHAITSGLLGLGWAHFYHKQPWPLLLGYIAAVLFHGLWNFNVVATLGGAGIGMNNSPAGIVVTMTIIAVQGVLVLISLALLLGIPLFLHRAKGHSKTEE